MLFYLYLVHLVWRIIAWEAHGLRILIISIRQTLHKLFILSKHYVICVSTITIYVTSCMCLTCDRVFDFHAKQVKQFSPEKQSEHIKSQFWGQIFWVYLFRTDDTYRKADEWIGKRFSNVCMNLCGQVTNPVLPLVLSIRLIAWV